MKYTNYKATDFIKDEQFKRWALNLASDPDLDYFWKSFLENHPEKTNDVLSAKALLNSLHYQGLRDDQLNAGERSQMFEKIVQESSRIQPKRRPSIAPPVYKVAAAIAFIIASAVVLSRFVFTHPDHSELISEGAIITKSVPLGQKLTIQLSDGSVVKLNSGSSLTYPEQFNDTREATLEGEAFFDVEKDPERPFIVKTGSVRTTVLGTSFSVKHYKDEAEIKVAVLTGLVGVNRISEDQRVLDEIILRPMQMASFNHDGAKIVKNDLDYKQVFAWKDNVIYFENSGLDEILKTLERWYGVQFELHRPISKEKDFTGRYDNKSLSAVMEGLSYIFEFKFTINDKKVIIY